MPAKSEYVYVIRGADRNKVGIAANVERRLMDLRGDGALEIVKAWHRPDDARKVEYNARQILLAHCVKGFEWFSAPVERLVEAVESAIELVEAGQGLLGPRDKQRARDAAEEDRWRKHREKMVHIERELNAWLAKDEANVAEFEATMKKLSKK